MFKKRERIDITVSDELWKDCYKFKKGDLVVCWREKYPNNKMVGKIHEWHVNNEGWGCTVILLDGREFYPSTALCLEPATKLHKALL